MEMEILSLGEKIRRKRKGLNMTLRELAGDRITPGQISLVESSKSNPSMELLDYLACKLETTPEYLMEAEETQARKVCIFFQNLAESYLLQGEAEKSELYIEKSLFYAKEYNLEYIYARCLYLKGQTYILGKKYSLAQQILLSCNVIFNKLGKYEDTIESFLKLGEISLDVKSYDLANTYFRHCEKVYLDNSIENDFLAGRIYYYISYSYYKINKTEESVKFSYLSEEKFIKVNNKNEHAKELLLIADKYSKNKEIDKSIIYSKKALDIFKELDNIKNTSEIENSIGKLFSTFGKTKEALEHLANAKQIRKVNKDSKVVDTLINICDEHLKANDIKSAKEVLDEVMNEVQKGPKKSLVKYYLLKYKLQIYEGNFIEAGDTLVIGLNLSKSMGYKKEIEQFCMMLGKHYLDTGDKILAAKYLDEGVESLKKSKVIQYL